MRKHSHSGGGHLKRDTLSWGCISALVFTCAAMLLAFHGYRHRAVKPAGSSEVPLRHSSADLLTSGSATSDFFRRSLYPYSVIPGGVENSQELRRAVEQDSIVAGHYADFDLTKARIVRLDRGRAAYVSYRIGDRIYWTKRKLWLAAGETLVTDGTAEARTRCGNRLSYVPQAPVSSVEPTEEAFEGALPAPAMNIPSFDLPLALPSATLVPPGSFETPFASSDYGEGIPLFVPPIFGGEGGVSISRMPPSTGEGEDTRPPTPPIATPEPRSAVMLAFGLAAVLFLKRKVR